MGVVAQNKIAILRRHHPRLQPISSTRSIKIHPNITANNNTHPPLITPLLLIENQFLHSAVGILTNASRNFLHVKPLDIVMCRCGFLRLVSLLLVTYSGRSVANDS